MHTFKYSLLMTLFDWNDEKNAWLKKERGVSFEDIVFHHANGGLLDIIDHPNPGTPSRDGIIIAQSGPRD